MLETVTKLHVVIMTSDSINQPHWPVLYSEYVSTVVIQWNKTRSSRYPIFIPRIAKF